MKSLGLVLFLWSFLSVLNLIGVDTEAVSEIRRWNYESWNGNVTSRYRRDVKKSLPEVGETSLVFVFDDTGSMGDDLVHLRNGAKSIVAEFEKRENNPIYNYVLVRFNDPRVSDAFQTLQSSELIRALDDIYVEGGGDCPELAFKGIINGINAALPKSPLFVFTDATAKDKTLLDQATNLAREKGISVSVLISGRGCSPRHNDFTEYNALAKRTSGQVYNVAKTNVEDVVKSIAEVLDTGLVPLMSTYSETAGKHDFDIDVDSSMKKVLASVTGKNPSIDFMSPSKEKNKNVKNILNLPSARIDKVDHPEPGKWGITTNSDSPHAIKISGVSDILVRYGFSYILPEEFSDTAPVPIKDISNYLSVFVWKNKRNHTFTHTELVIITPRGEKPHSNRTLKILDPKNCDSDLCIYATEAFIPPLDTFQIFVVGHDVDGNAVRYLVSTNIETVPGENLKPKVTVSSREVRVREGEDIHLVCKVSSTKRAVINWYFEDKIVDDQRNRRVNHKVKEVNLDFFGITLDDSGSYHCYANNPYGQHHEKVKVFVEAIPWNIEIQETDMIAIEKDSNYEIICKITPEERNVTVNWTFNDSPIIESDDVQISNDKLILKTVTRLHEGKYTCEGTFNEVTKSSTGHLTVHYPPKIFGSAYEKRLVQFDDKIILGCDADGNPKPTISWIRENGTLSKSVIENFSPADYGLHICEASNGVGSVARKNVMIETKYGLKPKVFIKSNKLTVNEDHKAILSCEVISPKPVHIEWIFNDGDKITESSKTSLISEKDKTILVLNKVQLEDAGTYTCVAENSFGKDEESASLKVVPIPLDIKIAKPHVEVTENDENVILECIVKPEKRRLNLSWMFSERILRNSERFKIFENKLIIKKAHRSDTGYYKCIGEFNGQTETSTGYLNVLYSPEIIGLAKEQHTIKFGDRVALNCSAVGNPEPKISWFREDESDTSPIIENFSPENYGNHICEASNGVGVPALKIIFLNSTASGPPKLITSDYYHEVKTEQNLTLKCRCEQCGPIHYSEWVRLSDGERVKKGVTGHSNDGSQNYNFDLHLINVTSADTSRYMCIIGNAYDIAKEAMRVNVTDQPTIKGIVARGADSSNSEVIKVQQGKQVILNCLVVGSPKPTVRWYKNGKPLSSDPSFMDDTLRFEKVTENDMGKYTCKATNALGTMSKDIKLLVILSNLPMNTILIADEGQTISLPCDSRTWLYNDELLDVSKTRYTVIENILVFGAKYEDSGIYQCLSLNGTAAPPIETVVMVQAAPVIVPNEDQIVRVRRSQEAVLKCKSQGNPLPEISWKFNQKNLTNSLAHEILQGGDLKIRNAREKNAGLYTCRASNKIGHAETAINVVVTVPPKITSEFNSTRRINPRDSNSVLTCKATGNPIPDVSWLRDGNVHVAERPEENFLNIGPYMLSGNYTCIAKNLDGIDSRSISITSRGPPILSDKYRQTRHHLIEGSELNLLCPVTDAKDIFWSKDGVKLAGGVSSGPQTLLTLPIVEREDAGVYTCTASNNFGEVSFTHHVRVFPSEHAYPNDILFEEFIKKREGDGLILECRNFGDIKYPIKWLKNNRFISDEVRLELNNIQLNDTGRYECKDRAEEGYVSQIVYLTVASRPNIQMAKETWTTVKEGESLELECIIAGIPQLSFTWTKDSTPLPDTNTILTRENVDSTTAGKYECLAYNELGLAAIVHHVNVLRAPRIKVGTREIMLRQTDEATFACEATGNPLPTLVWSFQESKLLGTESLPISNETAFKNIHLNNEGVIVGRADISAPLRASVKYNKDRIIFRVMLKGERKLPGRYTCSAINTLGTKEAEIELKLLEPPSKLKDAQRSKVSVLAGLPLLLSCPWSQDRVTTVQWVKNGIPFDAGLSYDRGTLSIAASALSNAGLYACRAKNFGGESKKEFEVQIRGTPYYDIDPDTNNVVLKCPATEISSDLPIWDELLIGEHNVTNNDVETSAALTINDAHPKTIYTCYHEDFDTGARTKKLDLQVLLTATVRYIETFRTAYIGDVVRMYCPLVPEKSKSNIDWFKDDRRIMRDKNTQLTRDRKTIVIRKVSSDDEGTYKCKVFPGDTERGIVLKTKQYTPEWSDWEPWTPCSQSCGTGIHTRKRQCISPKGETWHASESKCSGDATETESCNNFPCPANGNWSEWSDWTSCPDKCWDTLHEPEPTTERSRQCTSPEPFMGGEFCAGSATETSVCPNSPCPIHGQWSAWSEWSACSVTCGTGTRTRKRQCTNPMPAYGGNECVGSDVIIQRCRYRSC